MSKTNKSAYKRHQYSGPLKSRKRIRVGIDRYHDGETSRFAVWRKEVQTEDEQPNIFTNENTSCNENIVQNTITTYERSPSVVPVEPTYYLTSRASSSDPPVISKPVKINWPLPNKAIEAHRLNIEICPDDSLSGISGYRIVDLKHVIQWAFSMERHRTTCNASQIRFVSELRNGFHSIFTFQCNICDKTWKESSEKDHKINTSFVWATVTAGSYYSQAAHMTSLMDIPTMTANKFRSIEKELGNVWQEHLTEEVRKAGEQERAIAIEKGHVSRDGVPYITVYVDGGWLKRSYGHNFDSPSGMACIIGRDTKKCIFLGVRNKYCYTCQYYERNPKHMKPHTCCKNFNGPSTAMEAEIIVDGFQKSEQIHGLRYLFFIGDGDSSVFSNLREKVSYGHQIKKIECKNHVIKNYTGSLYKILSNTKLPLYGRNLLKPRLIKLTLVARKIIIQNSSNPCAMADDLKNGPLHVFGKHEKCKEYYCKWKHPSDEAQRKDDNLVDNLKKNATEVWALIYAANENVALKAGRLSNETTNIAENFMSVINKLNCGKRVCLGKGGSYQRRVHVAGLSQTAGHKWHEAAWKKQTLQSPGLYFRKYIQRKHKSRMRQQTCTRKRLFTPKVKSRPDKHYGPEACDPVDIDEVDLRKRCEERLNEFQKCPQDIASIEMATIGQHDNDLYVTYRNDRLTASQFGMVSKRRNSTPCQNHVKAILYKNNICTKDMMYGQQNETVARSIFMQRHDKTVRPAGLFIDEEFGFLAASPDGIIEEENAVVEIKCFPSLARCSKSIATAAKEKTNFALRLENGILVMNKKHDYYYQVQGQLRVTKMNKCYFICFISVTEPLTVIEVYRDEEFISSMIPKLARFFKDCIMPEIILRRVRKNAKCIDLNEINTGEIPPSTSASGQ